MVEHKTSDQMMQPCRNGCGELVHLENDGFHVCRTSNLVADLRSRLHGDAPTLHDGKTVKAKCVACGNFNRFWHIVDACNFCQSCVSEALGSPIETQSARANGEPGPWWTPTAEVERLMRWCKDTNTITLEISTKVLEGLLYDSLLWRKDRAARPIKPVETEARQTNFAWVPWHPKKGYELEEVIDREEDRYPMAPGWQWLPVYSDSPEEPRETSSELSIVRNALGNLVAAFVNTQGSDHINPDIAFALREARQVLGGPYLPVEPSEQPPVETGLRTGELAQLRTIDAAARFYVDSVKPGTGLAWENLMNALFDGRPEKAK